MSFPSRLAFKPSVVQLRSQDIDEVNHLLSQSQWQPNLVQLEPGLLEHHYLIAQLGGIQFARVTVNLPMLHRSGSPDRTLTFALPLSPDPAYTWCGFPLTQCQIIVHRANQEVNLLGRSSSDFAVVTLDVDDFLGCGMPEDHALFERIFAEHTHVLAVNQTTFLRVKHYLQELFTMIQTQPQKATHPVMQTIIRNDFLPLLLECLATSLAMPEASFSHRYQMVKQVEAHMLTHLNQPLTLQDLCTVVGAKSRTLQTAFLAVYGTSPMAYLKIQRLYGARLHLQSADPKTGTVVGIATNWGFWHMGHFSRDYKQMFGETPSQTLKRV